MLESLRTGSLLIRGLLVDLFKDSRGVTAVEYGVIAALIVVVSIAAIFNLGQIVLVNLYEQIAAATTFGTR